MSFFSYIQKNFLIVIISVVFLVVLDLYIKKEKKFDKLSIISLGMIMGGIFGNLIDRIIYHSVIDYLSFTIFNYSFPIFNLADIGITVGVFLLIINELIKIRKDNKK